MVIEQEQIDSALAKNFPLSKKFLLLFTITFSNPKVTLLDDSNRVRVEMDAELGIKLGGEPKNFGGHCSLTSGLSYQAETQEFFLADAQLDQLVLEGVPQKHLDKATAFASDAARVFIQEFPIYRLEAKDTKTTMAKLLLKDVQIQDQAIKVTLGY